MIFNKVNKKNKIVGYLFSKEFILSMHLKSKPMIFKSIARFTQNEKKVLISDKTDIVIEGFLRTANHYAVVAFQVAQRKPVNIAHHFHSPAQIIIAKRKNIPAITLIRNPIDVAKSLKVYHPNLDIKTIVKGYILFYEPLLDIKDYYVVGEFYEVTTDFGKVIEKVNQKFKTNFNIYEKNEYNEKLVAEEIKKIHQKTMKGKVERKPLPDKEKDLRKKEIEHEIKKHSYLFDKAIDIYNLITKT